MWFEYAEISKNSSHKAVKYHHRMTFLNKSIQSSVNVALTGVSAVLLN